MDAVIKIGGSVIETPYLESLCDMLDHLISDFSFVIIPGGGAIADQIRLYYKDFRLSEDTAHWMAILSENILGFLLLDKLRNGILVNEISKINIACTHSKIPVFLPFQYLFSYDPLPHSWDVTSDSIAAYLAHVLNAEKLILLKDVDGIFSHDPKHSQAEPAHFLEHISLSTQNLSNFYSCVDKYLPTLLKKFHQSCLILNGLYPDRLEKVLKNQKTIKTRIEL
ncbi:MAG: amino acid kinase family protein [Candidatus Helarchaeota archaeon]